MCFMSACGLIRVLHSGRRKESVTQHLLVLKYLTLGSKISVSRFRRTRWNTPISLLNSDETRQFLFWIARRKTFFFRSRKTSFLKRGLTCMRYVKPRFNFFITMLLCFDSRSTQGKAPPLGTTDPHPAAPQTAVPAASVWTRISVYGWYIRVWGRPRRSRRGLDKGRFDWQIALVQSAD